MKVQKIKTNHKDSIVKCLLCNKMIDLGLNYKVGKFITCKNCEMVYEIINIDPVMIDWPYYNDGDYYDDLEDYRDWS
jgi:transcription elongation factor Elf1